MSESPRLTINFYKTGPLLAVLAALSLWPALRVDSRFSLLPAASFLLLLALMITCKKANATIFALLSKEGFLYAILASLAVTLLSASLLLISAEAIHIDNTLNGIGMLRISLLIGALLGVMIWVPLSKRIGYKNIFMLKSFLISFALVSATIASQVNRNIDGGEEKILVRGVIEKKINHGGLSNFLTRQKPINYIYIPYDESIERLAVPTSVWDVLYKSAQIRLDTKTGYFGYDYVMRFNDYPL